MEKNKFVRVYMWVSLLFVLGMLIVNSVYLSSFPVDSLLYPYGFNGIVEKTFFTITLINYSGTMEIFNWPLIIHFTFFVLSGFNVYLVLRGEQLKKKLLTEVMVYNVVIALLLVLSSLLFHYLVPDIINGVIENGFFMTKIPRQIDDVVNVYNLSNLLLTVYFVLNLFALIKTGEKKVVQDQDFNEGELFL